MREVIKGRRGEKRRLSATIAVTCALLSAAWATLTSGGTYAQGANPTPTPGTQAPRLFDASHINLPPGYKIEVVVAGLSVPTTAIFDGNDLIVAESGWVNTAPPRIIRIKPDWS